MYGQVCRERRKEQYTTIKVRLEPTAEQAELFEKTFGCCRYIWTGCWRTRALLRRRTLTLSLRRRSTNRGSFLKEVDNQALIQEHNKLSQPSAFFSKIGDLRYPHFKRKKMTGLLHGLQHVFESVPHLPDEERHPHDQGRNRPGQIATAAPERLNLKDYVERTRTGKYHCESCSPAG